MNTWKRQSSGFTLIEVLIGILIFAVGMMALAHLQGNLSKSSGESTARTVALNIAEERIEELRTFSQVPSNGTAEAFNDIVSDDPENPPAPIERGGINYTVSQTVTNLYYHPTAPYFRDYKPNNRIVNPDLKRLELTVAWGTGESVQSFQIDGANATSGLGTGSVTLVDLISSFTTTSGAKVVLNSYGDSLYSPPVDYNPGQNPDIVSIELGANKFKESTTPLPDVIRANETVETTFDVVTYSQDEAGATFLRREEFRAVSCECRLQVPASSDEGGLRPTVWDGYEYTAGEFVSKVYGEESIAQQSTFCGMCCRDHHDGGTGPEDDANDPGRSLYNPFRSTDDYHNEGALSGDHKHYSRNRLGELVLADSDGDIYLEACRMIRKDGFWRLAQDLRQEGLNSFPADYLDDDPEIDEYSGYVTGAVSAYEAEVGGTNEYELLPPSLTLPIDMSPSLEFPASTYDLATAFEDGGTTAQQLRARGIYLDYMSDVLRTRINCLDAGGTGADCEVPDVNSALEIIPFYDVQLTWLARWNETPNNNPIDVTNEAIADNNTHDRGMASLESGFGYSTISSAVHTGNLGLTGTDPIDPNYRREEETYNMYALAVDYSTPPPLSGVIVSGLITSSFGGVKAADVEIEASEAQCDRTNTGFECAIQAGAKFPRIKVFNYFKLYQDLFGCSDVLSVHGTEHSGTNPAQNYTTFNLPQINMSNADIVIRLNSCD